MNKKLKNVLLVIVIILVSVFVFRAWQIKTGRMIKLENGNWISRADFLKRYPPEGTIFPDNNTPFDTYNQFYALIQKGDYENAVLLIDNGDPNRRDVYLKNFKIGGDWLIKWKSHLPQTIESSKLKIDGNGAVYQWDWGDGIHHPFDFSKNQNGLWYIENI